MTQKERLIIEFKDSVKVGDVVSFYRTEGDKAFSKQLSSEFVESRVRKFQLPILPSTGIDGEARAIAFERYFEIDFNAAGLMDMYRDENLIIIDIDLGWGFNTFVADAGITFQRIAKIPSGFYLTNAILKPSATPCDTILVEITTSEQSDSYSFGGSNFTSTPSVAVTTNPFTIEISRTVPTTILVHKSGKPSINVSQVKWGEPHIYIQKITYAATNIIIFNEPLLGASFVAYVYYPNQLSQRPAMPSPALEYSLNGVNWQTSNVFNGQVDGTYTMYIKDSLGCNLKKTFTVDGIKNAREPYVFISDLNSVGFAESEKWDGEQNGIDKNPENTLAESERYNLGIYNEALVFREDDYVRIQFKSNYDYNDVTMEGCGSELLNLIVEKKSKNLNQFEWLDAKMYSYGDGSLTAVYFDDGNVYEQDGSVLSTYELNGNKPNLAIIGNYIEVIADNGGVGGVFRIMDVTYDSEIGKYVIILQYNCESLYPVDVTTKSYFDILPYEVYEFKVPFYDYINDTSINIGRVRIQCTDDLYSERNFYSNWIDIIERADKYDLDKYFSFHYQNNNNRSIFYQYGIIHFFRAEVDFSNTIIDDSVETIKGDSSTYLSESTVHHGISIKFVDCTYKVMMKYILAISSETLFVNGLGYAKKGSVESEPVPNTNLYSLTVTLLRNTQNFNTFVNSNSGLSEGYVNVYIPKLITTNLGNNIKA